MRVPTKVLTATKDYRDSQDVVARFLAEATEADRNGTVGTRELYAAFKGWADMTGECRMTQRRFGIEIGRYYKRKHENTGDIYLGIRLKGQDTPGRVITLNPALGCSTSDTR